MANQKKVETTGVLGSEEALSQVVDELWQAGFGEHDVGVQGAEEDPESPHHAVANPGDYSWVLGFTIALPIVAGMILGILFVGGIHEAYSTIWLGAFCGAVAGGAIGLTVVKSIQSHHQDKINRQIKKGGFVVWINTDTPEKLAQAKDILASHNAEHIQTKTTEIS